MEKLLKDIIYGAQQIPGAGGAPGMVDAIVKLFVILEEQINLLSIQHVIDEENLVLVTDRVKELENKSCCKDPLDHAGKKESSKAVPKTAEKKDKTKTKTEIGKV